MSRQRRPVRLQTKLLLSYGLVIAVGVGGLVAGMQIVAPSRFDRMLGHMGGGMMGGGMSEAMRADTDRAFRSAMVQASLIAATAAILAAVAVGLVVARRITAPVRRMVEVSRLLAAGDYRARIHGAGDDELGELAAALNEMAAALEAVERRRVHLIGDVAHEVRTPVATLRGYLEGLQDGVVDPSPALWTQLHDETTRLTRLIDDLQELSRVEAGQVAIERAPVAAARLIETAVSRLATRFAEKPVELRVAAEPDLPEVLAAEDRTVQILTNLLVNALRYTPAGGRVDLDARRVEETVCFTVRDTGIGIAPEHLPYLFDRFYRADPSRARALGGSGIGLTIAKALVEAQGGRIWAESRGSGRGAAFSFTLPIASTAEMASSVRATPSVLSKS